ncbi:HNH endonuclease signature motif containing protein [Streptomyces sp. NPDC003344]|uniref:HNH endonuclease signature motif containing protein n=1 Tax=Streptomyces sp. NPDC003344 TaxID=3364682 RepID=UPI0036949306
MGESRRKIPNPIKREVRQRCGFGCVICGLPLYEYEHMTEWAKTKRHVADEITLLCNRHHAEKTRGLLPIADVVKANENPKNLRSGDSAPYDLHFSGETCLVSMGSNRARHFFSQSPVANALVIDGFPVIKFEKISDHLLLSLRIERRDGKRILEIDNNELKYSIDSWDIELVGTSLTVRGGLRKILAEIKFDPTQGVTISRGTFARAGHVIRVEPDYMFDEKRNVRMSNSFVDGCPGWAFAF